MQCRIENCGRCAMYKGERLCQMHYFRRMRNGYFEKKTEREYPFLGRKYRQENPDGYQRVYEPDCPLSDSSGYVYEHRFIYFTQINSEVSNCELCGKTVTWDTCHIDHKDENVRENGKENLRCLCIGCNTFRGHTNTSMGKMFLTINGTTKTPTAWARTEGVIVCGPTIQRRKRKGWSDYDAVYASKKTHINVVSKKLGRKYDKMRGILFTKSISI